MQMFDVGIQLAEIALQLDESADLMQRVGEVHVGAVEVAQAVEIARVEAGELAGEGLQEAAHACASGRLRQASSARARPAPRSTAGAGESGKDGRAAGGGGGG